LIRWHRKGFRLFWKWKSRGDRNVPSCLCVRYHGNRHRRILHFNTTCHPTAEWTLQQFRECVTGEEPYKFIIHDRDSIYSKELDSSLRSLGLRVLRTPYRSPQANAFCERLIGSARRECVDFMIPLNESHIRIILKPWVAHFNEGRPHSSLGPGIPEPSFPKVPLQTRRHHIPITIACRQFPYSAAFTTNINWTKSRLEKFRMSYLRSTITVVDARLHIVDHHSFRTSLKKLQTTFETIDDGIDILTKYGNHAAQAAVAKRHHECVNDLRLLTAQFI